jgi:hypothetical protein
MCLTRFDRMRCYALKSAYILLSAVRVVPRHHSRPQNMAAFSTTSLQPINVLLYSHVGWPFQLPFDKRGQHRQPQDSNDYA